MNTIFGGLIEFPSEKEFEDFLQQMNESDGLSIIEKAIEHAYQNNVYTVQETYFIYKSLKKIKDGFNIRNAELQQGEGDSPQ